MPSDESKTDHFFEHFINLHNKNVNYWKKVDSMFDGYEIEFNNDSISTDLSAMKNSFEGFCYKFNCIRKKSYKTLVEDEYEKYKKQFEDTDQ